MAITATVNTIRTVVGSVSQGNQPQVTRVTVQFPKGDTGAQVHHKMKYQMHQMLILPRFHYKMVLYYNIDQ